MLCEAHTASNLSPRSLPPKCKMAQVFLRSKALIGPFARWRRSVLTSGVGRLRRQRGDVHFAAGNVMLSANKQQVPAART
ncbi:hypothetical protein BaRGS_00021524 [Batillaria attramentaria]|uniref:Uncharacterized protein n=1 Tax=Batillaria attramentaria TaxID=370345 RepID=A0ABD0KJX3_9CAEN